MTVREPDIVDDATRAEAERLAALDTSLTTRRRSVRERLWFLRPAGLTVANVLVFVLVSFFLVQLIPVTRWCRPPADACPAPSSSRRGSPTG